MTMWRAPFALHLLVLSLIFSGPLLAAETVIGGNTDAQQCYMQTKLKLWFAAEPSCTRAIEATIGKFSHLNVAKLSKRDLAATYVNRGISRTGMEELDLALADFETALDLKPKLAEVFTNRGNVFTLMGDYEQALADYTLALELRTRHPEDALYNRGLVYEMTADFGLARADFQKALSYTPDWILPANRLNKYRHQIPEPANQQVVRRETESSATEQTKHP